MKTYIFLISLFVLMVGMLSGCNRFYTVSETDVELGSDIDGVEDSDVSRDTIDENEIYNPVIDPEDFSSDITNPYFSMPVGKRMIYEAKTDEGVERVEIFIPGWTKEIMGVETTVFWDKVYLDDELIEDTRDYIAEDAEGNVWYFGEDVDEYDGGSVAHDGAWIAGVDGALPGILMKASPEVGDEYRQEYYLGEAEDRARIESIDVNIDSIFGNFTDCLMIIESDPLESSEGYKYYCKEVGGLILEEEGSERVQLIEFKIESDIKEPVPYWYASQGVLGELYRDDDSIMTDDNVSVDESEEDEPEVLEDEARNIAIKTVGGEVNDVEIEEKYGKSVYVVEVISNGNYVDVTIDMETGDVIDVEW